jgi:GNAT superfamily N-acetyltransferase
MSIAIAIRKVQRNLNDYGIGETLRKVVASLAGKVYLERTYRIYRRDLRTEQPAGEAPPGIELRVIAADDEQAVRDIETMEEWLQGAVKDRLSKGLCVAAFDGERVAGFNVIAFEEITIPLLNMTRRLRPGQAWSEQITVAKEYRKSGLATALRHRIFTELKQRGYRSLYGGTLLTNIASLKSANKVGFRFLADVRYRKVLHQEYRTYRRVSHVAP